jgi:hypothetical protein
MTYLLDADVFVEGKKRWYSFDFCPAFWSWLDEAHEAGVIRSVAKVYDEIQAGGDDLADWAKQRKHYFVEPDEAALAGLQTTSTWAIGAGYHDTAVATFLQAGDYYLVGQALAGDLTVVTHERPGATSRIKIPDACAGVGVRCCNPFEMLRRENVRFVLAP